ncbi:putative snapin/Pallidin/Snn1 [Plasmopara halstedii]
MTPSEDATFAQVAAQEKLQITVDELIAGLNEAKNAEGSAIVSYADRIRNFPARVEKLQQKLARIHDRLVAMKESPSFHLSPTPKFSSEEAVLFASPLF